MSIADIILIIIYLVGYIAHVVFAAVIGGADGDVFGFTFVGIISGIIWFIIDPILLIGLSDEFY